MHVNRFDKNFIVKIYWKKLEIIRNQKKFSKVFKICKRNFLLTMLEPIDSRTKTYVKVEKLLLYLFNLS